MVAVCVTVLNEFEDARRLVESLCMQQPVPDELVVVDGGSTDGTVEVLRRGLAGLDYAQVIEAPGSNIASGRNVAIAATSANLIAFTDAGILRSPGWLAALVAASDNEPLAAGSFGYVLAAPTTPMESAIGAVGLPLASEIDPAHYPPSSGSLLIRRQWLERVGGYPEWLDFGEDLWLDRCVWAQGSWFVHASGANVFIRPRSDVASFFRQYFNYARGDGQARMLGKRHLLRFAAYGFVFLTLRQLTWGRMMVLVLMGCRYMSRPWARARHGQVVGSRAMVVGLVPIVRVIGDWAKLAGYIAGLWQRARS